MASGLIDILHLSPSELNLDRHAAVIRDRVADKKASIVVIDSISALRHPSSRLRSITLIFGL